MSVPARAALNVALEKPGQTGWRGAKACVRSMYLAYLSVSLHTLHKPGSAARAAPAHTSMTRPALSTRRLMADFLRSFAADPILPTARYRAIGAASTES